MTKPKKKAWLKMVQSIIKTQLLASSSNRVQQATTKLGKGLTQLSFGRVSIRILALQCRTPVARLHSSNERREFRG